LAATDSKHHVLLSQLEEELARAREQEAAGKEHLDAQEKRLARLKAKNVRKPQSERLLDTMRESLAHRDRLINELESAGA